LQLPAFALAINVPLKAPDVFRVSSTRHGVTAYSDNPPVPGGAKYPSISITTSVSSLAYTETPPFGEPAGIMAAFATTVPVAFRTLARG
jgi:hypothetical protein